MMVMGPGYVDESGMIGKLMILGIRYDPMGGMNVLRKVAAFGAR